MQCKGQVLVFGARYVWGVPYSVGFFSVRESVFLAVIERASLPYSFIPTTSAEICVFFPWPSSPTICQPSRCHTLLGSKRVVVRLRP
jgi:hypothetical protein